MSVVLKIIDSISEWSGKVNRWVVPGLVAVLTYEVVARYVFNAPTKWAHETTTFLLATIAVLGLAYTHLHHGHVRIDIIYSRLSPRGKATIDVICGFLLLFPLLAILIYGSFHSMWLAWARGELMIWSPWRPPAGPIKTVFLLGWCLFFLQSGAEFIRDLYLLVKNKSLVRNEPNV